MDHVFRYWTNKELERLRELHAQGKTLIDTAIDLNRSPGSVDSKLRSLGLTPRNKGIYRLWTPEEEARLIRLRQQGLSARDVAKKLKRSPGAVQMRTTLLTREGRYTPTPRERVWTPEEEARLVKYLFEGLSYMDIGLRLGRTRNSIAGHKSRLRKRGVIVPSYNTRYLRGKANAA